MANLIITVISIALVAVAALMGAYYGGTAFMEGQSKANANTIINQGEQIVGAWTTYSANNSGAWGITTNLTTTLVSGTPQYLTALPTPPAAISGSTYTSILLSDATTTTGTTVNGVMLAFVTSGDAAAVKVCGEIAKAAGGASATATAVTADDRTPATGRRFDCVYIDDDTSSSLTAGDDMFFVYRAR